MKELTSREILRNYHTFILPKEVPVTGKDKKGKFKYLAHDGDNRFYIPKDEVDKVLSRENEVPAIVYKESGGGFGSVKVQRVLKDRKTLENLAREIRQRAPSAKHHLDHSYTEQANLGIDELDLARY